MIDRDNDRRYVAWGIETTGFEWDAELTVSGFWFPCGTGTAELILNTNNTEVEADQYEAHLEAVCGGATIMVTPASDETALLEEMQQVVYSLSDQVTRFGIDRLIATIPVAILLFLFAQLVHVWWNTGGARMLMHSLALGCN